MPVPESQTTTTTNTNTNKLPHVMVLILGILVLFGAFLPISYYSGYYDKNYVLTLSF